MYAIRSYYEKADTETGTVGGALDQAGNIGNDAGLAVSEVQDPQLRLERGKRIGSDLGVGGGKLGEQGRFPSYNFV